MSIARRACNQTSIQPDFPSTTLPYLLSMHALFASTHLRPSTPAHHICPLQRLHQLRSLIKPRILLHQLCELRLPLVAHNLPFVELHQLPHTDALRRDSEADVLCCGEGSLGCYIDSLEEGQGLAFGLSPKRRVGVLRARTHQGCPSSQAVQKDYPLDSSAASRSGRAAPV